MPDGRDVVCTVIRGDPGAAGGVRRAQRRAAAPADDEGRARRVERDDRHRRQRLRRHRRPGPAVPLVPGKDDIADLGQVAKDQTFIWDVAPGEDGEVFLRDVPRVRRRALPPKDGFREVSKGRAPRARTTPARSPTTPRASTSSSASARTRT
jgi:hypothetical protein